MSKLRAIFLGSCPHDNERYYRCPACNKTFGSWSIFHNQKNKNGLKTYCPNCKVELDGL